MEVLYISYSVAVDQRHTNNPLVSHSRTASEMTYIVSSGALNSTHSLTRIAGRSGLVVASLPAAREGPGSNRAAGKSLCFHEDHCDTQIWLRAAH